MMSCFVICPLGCLCIYFEGVSLACCFTTWWKATYRHHLAQSVERTAPGHLDSSLGKSTTPLSKPLWSMSHLRRNHMCWCKHVSCISKLMKVRAWSSTFHWIWDTSRNSFLALNTKNLLNLDHGSVSLCRQCPCCYTTSSSAFSYALSPQECSPLLWFHSSTRLIHWSGQQAYV